MSFVTPACSVMCDTTINCKNGTCNELGACVAPPPYIPSAFEIFFGKNLTDQCDLAVNNIALLSSLAGRGNVRDSADSLCRDTSNPNRWSDATRYCVYNATTYDFAITTDPIFDSCMLQTQTFLNQVAASSSASVWAQKTASPSPTVSPTMDTTPAAGRGGRSKEEDERWPRM
eukprot:Opistho-1_new@35007